MEHLSVGGKITTQVGVRIYWTTTLQEVQEFATRWLWHYNHERPNMGLGGITPKQKLALVAWAYF